MNPRPSAWEADVLPVWTNSAQRKLADQHYIVSLSNFHMDAKCPECEKVASFNEDKNNIKCSFCGFTASYDEYIEIMKEKVQNMIADYSPDRPGF